MKVTTRVEIKLDNFDKCYLNSDADCTLGQLYDYACAFKAFISQKIQEVETHKPSEINVDESEKAEK